MPKRKYKASKLTLARNLIKDEIKKTGSKICYYDRKEITAAARKLLELEPKAFQ